jgi:UDP-N-acetylglucosamine 2-epimerase (non-hydrolysing)
VRPVHLIVGARPNLVKAAALVDAHREAGVAWELQLVHTGQHYDDRLSRCFFDQLHLPPPLTNLGVGAGTISVQTARILERLEELFAARRPSCVLVVGDVTSTLAAALTARRLSIPVVHVEAGLRSFDERMPEEINRRVADMLSDLLFVTEPSGIRNLQREGVDPSRIHFVGNPMIDTLLRHRDAAAALDMPSRYGLHRRQYVLVTLHRPSNVDSADGLARIVAVLAELAAARDVVFPAHPRTIAHLSSAGLQDRFHGRLKLVEPLPYLEFISLVLDAGAVLTDSGGLQEETTALGVPCVTLRASTERPVTVEAGTNVMVGEDPERALREVRAALARPRTTRPAPEKWDGRAGARIMAILDRWLKALG